MRKKILIVEDSILNLAILTNTFDKNLYEIETAKNVQTAIELYRSFEPDLILLDLELPDSNGTDVITEVQANENSNTKIIILTSHAEKEIVKAVMSYNIDGYFVKPYNLPIIKERIRKLLPD